jgi:hypothetical protein
MNLQDLAWWRVFRYTQSRGHRGGFERNPTCSLCRYEADMTVLGREPAVRLEREWNRDRSV